MDLEGIQLSEISQIKKDKHLIISLICGIFKTHLLLERKAMRNLDSILKSRDIMLPTKAHIVKAMVFPIVMYG